MKILIVALNSKYTHTCLSVRYLNNAVKEICESLICEYTINDNTSEISRDLYSKGADCIAFSCYIWNIEKVLKISSELKKANPKLKIVLGGHEVEHNSTEILKENPMIDAVLRGEGEISLRCFVESMINGKIPSDATLITYRESGNIVCLPDTSETVDLNKIPFPYDETIDELKTKIIYYESSRGCPYNCTYCISGKGHKVRFLDVSRVKEELMFFISHKVPLVKFVDRTFNADVKRAKEIFKFLAENPSDTCFHMELAGNLIDDETLEILSKVPKGALQFEIGVQTTNPCTMDAIERKVPFERLSQSVKKLIELGNIHIHLDLIAGLPKEDLTSFKKSFDDVISLRPDALQLGFLKLLKGSKIRREEDLYGYVYSQYPPYEVISNNFITYREIQELKITENALDKYYNSNAFKNSLDYLFNSFESPYMIFYKLGNYISTNYPVGYGFSRQQLFDVMYKCFNDLGYGFSLALKKDYLQSFKPGKRPYWFDAPDNTLLQKVYSMFKDEEYKKEKYPFYYDLPAKEIMKHIYAEKFDDRILVFDYNKNLVYDETDYLNQFN